MNVLLRLIPLILAFAFALDARAADAAQLTIYTADPASLANDLAKGFEAATGTQMRVYAATTGQEMARLQAEEGRPQADIVILAAWSAGLALQEQNQVFAYRPAVVLKTIRPGFAPPGDFLPIGGDTVSIVVNTSALPKSATPHDWFDLQQTAWNGKISMPDPLLSGTSSDFVLAFIAQYGNRGWNFFRAIKAGGAIWPGPNAAALAPVTAGARWALLAGVGHIALDAKAQGNTLDLLFPSSGTVLIPRPIIILKSSPSKALAERFVDYALSPAGQQLVAKANLLPAITSVPASSSWPNLQKIRFLSPDWRALAKMREAVLKQFTTDILGR
ncbi:MAG TPA: extracellular solute-binding protein [Candidatus Binatia bacterium]|nr:extracellular solute-binding protein [Candidatus Binatia bacterium]